MQEIRRCLFIGLFFLLAACGSKNEPENQTDPADAADSSDASDASDSTDAADSSDASDASDSTDAADSSDASDASDSTDAADSSDASDVSDSTDAADPSDASDVSDSSDGSDTADPTNPGDGGAVLLDSVAGCPQSGHFLDAGLEANYIDYNGDGETNADRFNNSSLTPSISVSCNATEVSVTSNGVINYDYVIGNGANPSPQVNQQTFTFPKEPAFANSNTAVPRMGLVAVLINGVQIFGPNELLSDNGADPYLHGLLGYCNGHVHTYHGHAFPECFYGYATLEGADTLLEEGLAGQVLGYAMDGFPILAPYECASAECSSVLPVESSWEYDTGANWTIDTLGVSLSGDCAIDDAGGYSDNYAWGCNTYEAKPDTQAVLYADECNGRTRADGTYAYYATRKFPYYVGCFRGTAEINGGGGGGGGPPPN